MTARSAGSSNGRTLGSGQSSQGSNPCPAASLKLSRARRDRAGAARVPARPPTLRPGRVPALGAGEPRPPPALGARARELARVRRVRRAFRNRLRARLPRLPAQRRCACGRLQREPDLARFLRERVPRLLRLRAHCGTGADGRRVAARPSALLPTGEAPSARGEHPARQRAFEAPGRACRLPLRGLLAALSEDRRPLARPRALGDHARGLGGALAEFQGVVTWLVRNEPVAEDADDGALGLPHVVLVPWKAAEHPAGEDLLERAVDDPRRQPGREVVPKHLLLLSALDDPLQGLERERDLLDLALQLLAASRHFADEHAHDVRVVAPRPQDDRATLAQLLARRLLDLLDSVDRREHHRPHLAEDRFEDGVLRLEVVVDEPVGNSRFLGDVADAARVVALLRESPDGGVENLPAPLLLCRGARSHLARIFTAERCAMRRRPRDRPNASLRTSPRP